MHNMVPNVTLDSTEPRHLTGQVTTLHSELREVLSLQPLGHLSASGPGLAGIRIHVLGRCFFLFLGPRKDLLRRETKLLDGGPHFFQGLFGRQLLRCGNLLIEFGSLGEKFFVRCHDAD